MPRPEDERFVPLAVSALDAETVYVRLAPGEPPLVRDSVPLDSHEEADRIPALDAITLDFDFYGRLVGVRVAGSPDSVLAPELLDVARRG